jgi:hypothetical protein
MKHRNSKASRTLAVLAACGMMVAGGMYANQSTASAWAQEGAKSAPGTDVLIFRKGTVLTGTITGETATTITFQSDFNGLPFTSEYAKADILEVKRGAAAAPAAPATPATAPETVINSASPPATDASAGKTRYCYMTLNGNFGEQISQSPILKAMKEAIKQKAEVIIVEVDNTWKMGDGELAEEAVDAAAAFDEFHRAEKILEVFATAMPDIARESGQQPPRLVFWVRRAMGGAAFLPLMSKEIYFHPEGKIGGVGNLATMMKGHERVVEKQISLRLKRAIGWVNLSGYAYSEELVRSMTQDWYVSSVRFQDGRPVIFEGLPENPGEELLTDDGKEDRKDGIEAIARNEGNDVLTLNERNAKLLGLSKGTVESKSDLLAALRLDRAGYEVPGKPERVMEDWRVGLERAMGQVRDLWREYNEVQVGGDYDERRRARSTQLQKLNALVSVLKMWAEGLPVRELYQIGLPMNGGDPNYAVFDNIIEKIKMQQRLDRR